MKHGALAAAIGALALLTYFGFPGHTWLQQDSQIYVPILENQHDPLVLRNDIVVQHPHVAFTQYDEATQFFRNLTGQSFHTVLAAQQIATRALGIWGLYLMATALGLATLPALAVTAICSLGASITGPAVMTFEYEPTPRAFAVPLLLLAMGLTAHRRYTWAALATACAIFYHVPTTWPFLAVFVPLACWRKQWQALGMVAAAIALLAFAARGQTGQTLFGTLTPLQQQLQPMRAAYAWISLWPRGLWLQWTAAMAIVVAAWWRLRASILILAMPALGVLAMPVSWLLLDQWKWSILPQIQPMRALLFTALMLQFLTACAAVHASARRQWLEAFAWFAAALLLPLQPDLTKPWAWQRMLVLAALAALCARVPLGAFAAFLAIPLCAGVVNYPDLHTPALAELSRWAEASTSRDAVFLFPEAGHHLDPGIFRAEAQRAVYADWKGGGQVNYLPDFATDWWFRWQQTMLGFHAADLPRYEALGVNYVVLPHQDALPRAAAAFSNATYTVYALTTQPVASRFPAQAVPAAALPR